MLFTTWKIKEGKELKLRLTSQNCVKLEKELEHNPLDILTNMDENKLPKLGDLILVISNALIAYNHGIGLKETYDLFDEWVAEGHDMLELFPIIIDVYKTGGLIPEKEDQDNSSEDDPKN